MLVTIGLALPLMFFSIDVRRWSRLAGKSLLSFGLQILAVVLVAAAGFFIFRFAVGGETWKIAGMFVGVYTGGTVNLGAIATALRTDQTLYLAAHTADVLVSSVYLFFLMTVGAECWSFSARLSRRGASPAGKVPDYNSYAGIFAGRRGSGLPKRGLGRRDFAAGDLACLVFLGGCGFSRRDSGHFHAGYFIFL
jgi:hypothetical protein